MALPMASNSLFFTLVNLLRALTLQDGLCGRSDVICYSCVGDLSVEVSGDSLLLYGVLLAMTLLTPLCPQAML